MVAKPSWPVLQIGSSGSNVIAFQYLMNANGVIYPINGFFSSEMDSLVKELQEKVGVPQTGKTDEAFFKKILEFTRAVKKPPVSLFTKAAQQLLNKFDAKLDVDGKFGPDTADALAVFQLRMGLNISGVVEYLTWQYLFGYGSYPADAVLPPPPSTKVYALVEQLNSSLTTSQVNANAEWIYNFFTNTQNCSGRGACAILGNMQMESQLNPGMWEIMSDAEAGYGVVQFTPASRFLDWASSQGILKPPVDYTLPTAANNLAVKNPEELLSAEMNYLMKDLASPEIFCPPQNNVPFPELNIQTFNGFKRSDGTVAQLTEVFLTYYERPKDSDASLQYRINFATAWAKYFNVNAG